MARIKKVLKADLDKILQLGIVFSKQDLRNVLQISSPTLNRIFYPELVENSIGVEYEVWKNYRTFPPEVAARIKVLFVSWLSVEKPKLTGIYVHKRTKKRIQVQAIDSKSEKVSAKFIDPITGKPDKGSSFEMNYSTILMDYELQD